MTLKDLSVKKLFRLVVAGLLLSMTAITLALFLVTKQTAVLLAGGVLFLCALVWFFLLTQVFGKRLSLFTSDLCQTLDHMIEGDEAPRRAEDSETMLARISHRLSRLYQIMQENRRKVDEERQELQALVSDISHQVKTPVSNLKMATDTLLENPMTEADTCHRVEPDSLIEAAGQLQQTLTEKAGGKLIKGIFAQVDQSLIQGATDFVYEHLPLFLTDTDYQRFDSLLTDKGIQATMQKNYTNLLSPAGIALRSYILRDPLGLGSEADRKSVV